MPQLKEKLATGGVNQYSTFSYKYVPTHLIPHLESVRRRTEGNV